MTWFAASIIVAVRTKKGRQKTFPVFENVYLIEAKSSKQAYARAEKIGKREQIPDDSLTLDGRPAKFVYVGVRKVVTIANPFPIASDSAPPRHGTEITYSVLQMDSAKDVIELARGHPVSLVYEE